MNNYNPPVGNTNYLNTGWGNTPQQQVANNIDHTADKIKFALQMQDMAIQAIDSVEKELVQMATAPHPPNSVQLHSLAHRLDAQQQQMLQVSNHIKQLTTEIDRATDPIQRNHTGW